ncbi:hypothetical protein Hanom_Chr12g01125721 [Helianthus anomalus]
MNLMHLTLQCHKPIVYFYSYNINYQPWLAGFSCTLCIGGILCHVVLYHMLCCFLFFFFGGGGGGGGRWALVYTLPCVNLGEGSLFSFVFNFFIFFS